MAAEREFMVPDTKGVKCLYCDQTFRTEAAERRHALQDHPDEVYLHCPACKQRGFKLPSDLMGHIERGKCILTLTDLHRRRRNKMIFRRQLNLQGPVRHDFTRFIDTRAPSAGQSQLLMAGAGNDASRQGSVLSATTEQATTSSRCPSVETVRSDGTVNSNVALISHEYGGLPEGLFPGEEDGQRDGVVQEAEKHPNKFLNEFSKKYHCPLEYCLKTFKNSNRLLAHLRSPAHSNVRYTCPECHNQLHCLQGMTAHAEDPASRCGISHTEIFGIYMEQLTGGLIDVVFLQEGKRIKYETSQTADAEFENVVRGSIEWA